MKQVKVAFFVVTLLVVQVMYGAKDKICDPDQSIENQKTKLISPDAQALLGKIVKDKVNLAWPVKVCQCWVSSLFGPRKSGHHNGVDLAASLGTPVYAAADGIVEVAEKNNDKNSYGNMILISHKYIQFKDEYGYSKHYTTRYAHLDSLLVKKGDKVQQGQQIGTVGATGHVVAKNSKTDPSHLHFEVYRGDKRVNPLIVLFATDPLWVKAHA